jgi:hypothetical protein
MSDTRIKVTLEARNIGELKKSRKDINNVMIIGLINDEDLEHLGQGDPGYTCKVRDEQDPSSYILTFLRDDFVQTHIYDNELDKVKVTIIGDYSPGNRVLGPFVRPDYLVKYEDSIANVH